MLPELISAKELTLQYQGLLFDAFGVLIHGFGGIPSAIDYIDELNRTKFPYWIVSNGSCFSTEETARSYPKRGLNISADKVITSGFLAGKWLQQNGFQECRIKVLGPESSHFMAKEVNARIVDGPDYEVLLIGNQSGFPFLESIDQVITELFQLGDKGQFPTLLLPNPDLIYPGAKGTFGMTSGMIALMIEAALEVRYGQQAPKFIKLGKPYTPIFEEAQERASGLKVAMIGDQLITDIKGANDAGIDSILIGTGISKLDDETQFENICPTWRMVSF